MHGSDYADDEGQTTTETSGRELGDELAAAVNRLRRALRRATRRHPPFEPLPHNQIDLLRLAAERPGVSVAAAAAALSLAPNTVSTLVNELCRADLSRASSTTPIGARPPVADRRGPRRHGRRARPPRRDPRAALGDLGGPDREVLAVALPALERLFDALERREGVEP